MRERANAWRRREPKAILPSIRRPTEIVPRVLDRKTVSLVIGLVASVQFFAGLDASMLLPLGPMLAAQLNFPVAHLGYLNGAFLIASAIAALIGSLCLDRFDRRAALSIALAGLAVGTAAAGFATSLHSLVICRVLAGLCGGPAVSLGLAVIGDVAPVEARGRAMGAVSVGASIALILGVPVALQIAEWTSWNETFFIIGGVGLALAVSAATFLPSGLGRRSRGSGIPAAFRGFAAMLTRSDTLLALANDALIFSSIQILAANLASYFLYNLGSAQHDLKYIWAAGGAAGLAGGQICGRFADRLGPACVLWGVSVLAAALYYVMFVRGGLGLPVLPMMCVFLVCASGRIVLSNLITSLTPSPEERGRFMSLMSTMNQAASAAAMICASQILGISASGALTHMDRLAAYAIGASLLSPPIAALPLHRLKARGLASRS